MNLGQLENNLKSWTIGNEKHKDPLCFRWSRSHAILYEDWPNITIIITINKATLVHYNPAKQRIKVSFFSKIVCFMFEVQWEEACEGFLRWRSQLCRCPFSRIFVLIALEVRRGGGWGQHFEFGSSFVSFNFFWIWQGGVTRTLHEVGGFSALDSTFRLVDHEILVKKIITNGMR